MKQFFILFISFFVFSSSIIAQYEPTDAIAKNEIQKLSFLVGNWSGKGWIMGADGKKHHFSQTENVQFKLDNTALLIEGLGRNEESIIHNAMAVVSYNKADKKYRFNSLLASGRGGNFSGELLGDKFYWYPGENMRYIIFLNDKGQWVEVGEMNRNGNWFQFFEMTLDKIK